ncbi:hypothetical protein L596_005275 [Steinernema carpocapsae]|uniref:Uncharacterized protein n=1 Tax=Steinernema carpocapsae TaxID=34508 RepID=A0A4U8UZK5_STECR|nr:hypothetical protein L596_005275 [Steinernema carpocapsae]
MHFKNLKNVPHLIYHTVVVRLLRPLLDDFQKLFLRLSVDLPLQAVLHGQSKLVHCVVLVEEANICIHFC